MTAAASLFLKMLDKDETLRPIESRDGDCLACLYVHRYTSGLGVAYVEYPNGAVRRVQRLDEVVGALLCTDISPADARRENLDDIKPFHEIPLIFKDEDKNAGNPN